MASVETDGDADWKEGYSPKPSISIRKGYASNYDHPYENTSTLVLTARSGRFVDIRFPLIFDGDVPHGSTVDVASHTAFWAFSGKATTTFIGMDGGEAPPRDGVSFPYSIHTIWSHEIDSKGPGISDEADMFELSNGDTMEVGMNIDKSAGKFEMYKEYWTEPKPVSGIDNASAQRSDKLCLARLPCIVADIVNTDSGRGRFIRLGNYCQGVYSENEASKVITARWELTDDPTNRNSTSWILHPLSSGDSKLFPFQWLTQGAEYLKLHDEQGLEDGQMWQIVEIEQ